MIKDTPFDVLLHLVLLAIVVSTVTVAAFSIPLPPQSNGLATAEAPLLLPAG
ncbi:hypothetical protein [Gloeobacter kilaueensis]|uniref:Uncharacterized protein n=1 Tax=Gloeobacter kilaueensis (strain ATCC BAA-2537 / CCAP 1431/1 / ULC 316 / JS1) TaxID=1183438 RepID=U5QF74_GLOK1|nr:hypothetical protein [Gloeobacter kilaueensis]AGY57586.1 hypothetical protein GKIL_1340 [Gloeobacter kilaueensis JS1]